MEWTDKLTQLRTWFAGKDNNKEIFEKLLELGKKLPSLEAEARTKENIVSGCQSLMYLQGRFEGKALYFKAHSEALISAGLAFILVFIFSGESPEKIIKSDLDFLKEFNIQDSLNPSRSNGLYSLHLKMRQYALNCYMGKAY